VAADDAGRALLARRRQFQAVATDGEPRATAALGDGGRRLEAERLAGQVGGRRHCLLAQRPQPFEHLFDVLFRFQRRGAFIQRFHRDATSLPSQRDRSRVSRVGAGTSYPQAGQLSS